MKPNISKPTAEQESEARSWPTWSKDASEFPWEYDQPETCLILEGDVTVTNDDGKAEREREDDQGVDRKPYRGGQERFTVQVALPFVIC